MISRSAITIKSSSTTIFPSAITITLSSTTIFPSAITIKLSSTTIFLRAITIALSSATIFLRAITIALSSATIFLSAIAIELSSATIFLSAITIEMSSATIFLSAITIEMSSATIFLSAFTIEMHSGTISRGCAGAFGHEHGLLGACVTSCAASVRALYSPHSGLRAEEGAMVRRRNGRDDREGRDAGEALKALEAIRRALTAEEAAQLDAAFPALLAAQFGFVGEQLRRRGLAEHEAEDLAQETFLALREHLRANGFPDDMAALLRVIVKRRFINHLRAKLRSPWREGG